MDVFGIKLYIIKIKRDNSFYFRIEVRSLYNLLFGAIALYTFFLCSTISNAGYSISCAAVFILVIWFYWKKKETPFVPDFAFLLLYGIFFILLFLSAFMLGDTNSLQKTAKYFGYSLPIFLLYYAFRAFFLERAVQLGCFMAAVVLSGYSVYQFFTFPLGSRIPSIFINPNGLPMILEVFFPFMVIFFFRAKKYSMKIRIIMGSVVIFTMISIILTQSRGGIMGIIFGFLALILGRIILLRFPYSKFTRCIIYLMTLTVIASSLAIFATTVFQRNYDSERILLLKSSYTMWNEHKVLGVGFDNWGKEYQNKYILDEANERTLDMPHNTIAFFFSSTGIIGGFGYLVFIFGTLCFLIKKIIEYPENLYIQAMLWAFIAVFTHGMVDAGITNKMAARLVFGFLGITLASLSIKDANVIR